MTLPCQSDAQQTEIDAAAAIVEAGPKFWKSPQTELKELLARFEPPREATYELVSYDLSEESG